MLWAGAAGGCTTVEAEKPALSSSVLLLTGFSTSSGPQYMKNCLEPQTNTLSLRVGGGPRSAELHSVFLDVYEGVGSRTQVETKWRTEASRVILACSITSLHYDILVG